MRIAVFFSNLPIYFSIYLIDLVDNLARQGFMVDLFLHSSGELMPKFNGPVSIVNLPEDLDFNNPIVSGGSCSYLDFVPKANREIISEMCARNGYRYCIGVESSGLCMAKLAAERCGCPYSLFNLEIYDSENPGVWNKEIVNIKEVEKSLLPELDLFMIPDAERLEAYYRTINVTQPAPRVLFFPISLSTPDLEKVERNFWRKEMRLPEEVKIVLYFGQLGPNRFNEEMVMACQAMRKDAIFVIKGILHAGMDYLQRLKSLDLNGRTAYDMRQIPWNKRIDRVIGADIGLVYYRPNVINDRLTGRSSDKLAAYMQAGVPCICPNYSTFQDVIGKYGNGVCIDSFSQIPSAVNEILNNHDSFKNGAKKAFEEVYNLDRHNAKLRERILERVGPPLAVAGNVSA